MKSLLIMNDMTRDKHVGEEYDEILEVPVEVTTENIGEWSVRIKDAIRRLWNQDSGENKLVKVWLDAAIAFHTMLANFQIRMLPEEGITVELPYAEKLKDNRKEEDFDGMVKEAQRRSELKRR